MKFLKEFSNWNPVINKDVEEFIQKNKTHLMHLWNKDKSEEENIELLKKYFREFPELMNDTVDLKSMTIPQTKFGIKNSTPILQNIGGVADFRSF
jgi:peroxiredoxin